MEALMLAKSNEVALEDYRDGEDCWDDVIEYALENSETWREYRNFVEKAREELCKDGFPRLSSFSYSDENDCKCEPKKVGAFCGCHFDKLMADNGIINLSQYFDCSLVNHLMFIGIVFTSDRNTMDLLGEELKRVKREKKKVKSILNKKKSIRCITV